MHQRASARCRRTAGQRPMPDSFKPRPAYSEHRNRRRVVEQHGCNQSSRGVAPSIVARQPAGDAQRQQRRAGDARRDQSGRRIERRADE